MYVRPRPRFRPRNAGSGNTPSLALEFNQLLALPSYVTFSRGTQAMQYGSDGTLQYAPNNLLTYSNQADNAAWTKSNSFVQTNLLLYSEDFTNVNWVGTGIGTPGSNVAIAPDGNFTADSITASAGTGARNIQQNTFVFGSPYTFSVYAKANTLGFIQLFNGALATLYANFNLSTGTVGTVGAGATAAISSAGNGWYRCSITVTAGSSSAYRIALVSSATSAFNESWTTTGTESVYLWGGQYVQGSVPGDYRATTSAALPVLYADYTGALRARKLCEDAAVTTTHWAFQSITTIASAYTVSEVMKAGERTWALIRIRDSSGNDRFAWFNLGAGTIGAVQTNLTASMVSLGSGWYRCSVTVSAAVAAANPCVFGPVTGDGVATYTGDGSSGIYIADAQLTPGYLPLAVTETTSAAVYGPRFDYDPVTKVARGLLIEEQRTNLALYSDQFDNAAWTKSLVTVTANSIAGPDGQLTADTITSSGGLSQCYQIGLVIVSGTTYTASCYMKAGTASFGVVNLYDTTALDKRVWFNLSTGTVGTQDAGITGTIQSIGNGWYRCTATRAASAISGGVSIEVASANGVASASAGNTIYAYGAQLEAGAFATSYVPTVASTATRNADSASITTLTPWFNAAAGTVYSQIDTNASAAAKLFSRLGPTISGSIGPYATSTSVILDKNGTGSLITSAGTLVVSNTKTAWAYDGTNVAMSVNGGAVATAAGALGTPADALYIGRDSSAVTNLLNGHIQSLRYYPTRLPNASLQSITA